MAASSSTAARAPSRSPAASPMSTWAASSRGRLRRRASGPASGGWRPAPAPTRPAPTATTRDRAAASSHAGWPGEILLRPRPARPAPGAAPRADSTRRRARAGRWLGQPLAGTLGFPHRVHPLAPELQDLGVAQQALTPVEHQLRLSGAPAGQRRGPLLGPSPVEDLLAARQHAAVDIAGHDRRHLARRYRDHGFIQQRYPLGTGRPSRISARPCPWVPERHQVAIGESLARSQRPAEGGPRPQSPSHDAPQSFRQQQISALQALARPPRESAGHARASHWPGPSRPSPATQSPAKTRSARPAGSVLEKLRCARPRRSRLWVSLPIRWAAVASRSRSSGESGVSRSAATR